MDWEFRSTNAVNLEKDLLHEVHQVYCDGFGYKGWSIEGVAKAFSRASVAGLLRDPENGELVGYAFYVVPEVPLSGEWFLWEDAICIRKRAQGRGLASRALSGVYVLHSDKEFSWIGGRTQNPLVVMRYAKLASSLFPIVNSYTSDEGRVVMQYLRQHIAEVRDEPGMNFDTGICRHAYKGRLGDYPVDLSNPRIRRAEERLQKLDFDRERGDAVIVVARTRKPIEDVKPA